MCGNNGNAEALIFPEKHNVSHCLLLENMESLPECEKLLQKTFDDLLCVERVRQEQRYKLGDCDCPLACQSFQFDTFYRFALHVNLVQLMCLVYIILYITVNISGSTLIKDSGYS